MKYPKRPDAYPNVFKKETDAQLPSRPDNRTRYMYFKPVARGGKCVISSCKDLHLRRTVCYKTLRPEIASNPAEQARFLREARVTAMLQHPNTVPTYELGRDITGKYYFTMKLVHGLTLREIIDQRKQRRRRDSESINLTRLIEILVQVCHAMHYAHIHGVVHRDIKPENILVGDFGEVMLLDWGTAKVWDDTSKTNVHEDKNSPGYKLAKIDISDASIDLTRRAPLDGTPPHMSTEQLQDPLDVDHRTDIYSLGTVLYELLTLDRMFQGDDVETVLERIQSQDFVPPRERRPDLDIPEELEEICLRCTLADRDQRYQSGDALIVDLERWVYSAKVTETSTIEA
ncbi:MAG: serine/threonine-protein kinase [Gammaproteobacteria bacterium]|nr:serine/threonine-protein kinase [Gammaproteobacteria bacterium]